MGGGGHLHGYQDGVAEAVVVEPAEALLLRRHATKGVRRLIDRRAAMAEAGKRPAVANCATARELACWVWAVGAMVEAGA